MKFDFGGKPAYCPAFALRLVRGVKNGPSPEWLQKQLRAIGLRPINTLVDITNYITFDRGRPLHVFDAAKVKGDLVVRYAKPGEKMVALDGKTYDLDETIGVIADDNGPESLAGIMGGEASGCDETTTDVLIESALWDPLYIAQAGRKLGVNSDARYRFERGVDPAFMMPGLELATQMVIELCGGTPSEIIVVGDPLGEDRLIDYPLTEAKRLTGLDLSLNETRRILNRLGFMVGRQRPGPEGRGAVMASRCACQGRHRRRTRAHHRCRQRAGGPLRPRRGTTQTCPHPDPDPHAPRQARARGARHDRSRHLVVRVQGAGRAVRRRQAGAGARQSDRERTLRHAPEPDRGSCHLGAEERRSRLPRCGAVRSRTDFLRRPAAGSVHRCVGRASRARLHGRQRPSLDRLKTVDAFDVKADALAALIAAGAPAQALQIVAGGPAWLHPGRSGTIQIGPQNILGYFGELHPRALEALGADGPLVAFEVILERIPEPKAKPTRAKPVLDLSPFQPVERDFAFIVERKVKAADIVRAAQGVDRKLIAGVNVFDLYEGKGIDPDKKSVAITVTLQPREKTLTDEEIEAVATKIVAEVTKKTGGSLRG